MAQRFYNLVLLPRIRDDIAEYKRLNFHLYMALKKALFKPAAWFKGRAPAGAPLGLGWVPQGLWHGRDPPDAAARVVIPRGCPQAQGLSPSPQDRAQGSLSCQTCPVLTPLLLTPGSQGSGRRG